MAPGFCYFLGVRTTAIFAFLILSVLGILAVLWANRLFRSYRQAFLQAYALHLAFWHGHALVQVTQYILGSAFLAAGALDSLATALWPLYILLMGLSLYFLTGATAGFRGRTPSLVFRVGYLAFWAVVVAASAILLGRAAARSPDVLIGTPLLLTALLKNGTILGCMSWLVWSTWRGGDPLERRFAMHFAGLYLAGYVLFQLSAVGIIPLYVLPFPDYVIAFIQVGFQFPPLIVLAGYLRQQAISRPPVAAWMDFEERLAPLDLSPREAEIAGLVLRGYSNREIEERLFISLETVKKHVSNIYRKLGVKNRVQLSNFIQNRCGVRPDDVPPARL